MTERINDSLTLTFPDGFARMSADEKRGMTTLGSGPWEGFRDPERHMIVTVGWKRINLFSALLLSGKDLAKNAEKQVCRSMKPFGYRSAEFSEARIGGASGEPERASGFRYAYDAQGVGMRGEACVVKRGRDVIFFHVYYRDALSAESVPVWEKILSSARFGNE